MEKEYQKECEITCEVTVDGYTDFIFINRFGGVQHQGLISREICLWDKKHSFINEVNACKKYNNTYVY